MSTNFRDVNRTISSGELVISVAEIFDRLQTKVDPNTLEQLLRDILANRRGQVRPGELITAELMNQILAELESLSVRVLKLETAAPGTGSGTGTGPGTTPATGGIEVRYKDSPRGVQLVPGDASLYPHTFTLANSTDQALIIHVAASVTAPRGDWSKSAEVALPEQSLATGASRDFTVNIRVPADAQVGDAVVLRVEATVGAPHNKLGRRDLPMTLASASGPPVTRSLTFVQALQPPNPTNVPTSQQLPFTFDLRYAASQAPFSTGFKFTATLTAEPTGSVGDWFIDFQNVPTTTGSAGVITTPLTLDTNSTTDTRVIVRVRTPFQRAAAAKTATLVVRVEPTDTSLTMQPVTSGPFTLRLNGTTT